MEYRDTLNLPKTGFKMKANLAQREPEVLRRWQADNLYQRVQEATKDRPLYVLHDGPPYANGHIHLGTAFNKVLKDIILRSRRMAGYHCPYVPGWDCHGLPIEHNVDKELGEKKKDIPKVSFRGACRKYAEKWIKTQKEEFQRLGVLGDWDNPYRTIEFGYEAAIAAEFLRFLESGAVVRALKPVYWCTSCRTALAEAEVEYHDHGSPSIYVRFPLDDDAAAVVPGDGAKSVVIWTTTPWTLPANLAVALHPDAEYVAVESGGEVLVLAAALRETFFAETGLPQGAVLGTLTAGDLAGRHARHPFMERQSLFITADYVTMDTGTGCVHTAPGHGREDYLSGLAHDLPPLSPVDADGVFTDEAGPYAGLAITEANDRIIDDLRQSGHLVHAGTMEHSYPHCWRCKRPVIFRATDQWFIAMDRQELRQRCLAAIDQVGWVPRWGRDRIHAMVAARPDWCLSRQRAWGVPLTVVVCRSCGAVVNDRLPEINRKIVAIFEQEGADAWFTRPLADFTGDCRCPDCGSADLDREEDILDVWFDSGVSHAAVLERRPELASPADLYLEGSDQHRGWFQSSLITSVGTRGRAPFKNVLTHGFVVDGEGRKMSKSVGNVIAPAEVIKKYGAEILRLWVASEDYRDDIKISDDILAQLADAYRKIRNTIRFLLGNLEDFDPATDRLPVAELAEIDRWVLARFEQLKAQVTRAYETFDFHQVFHRVYNFCTVTLSALYLDIQKDCLYCEAPKGRERRSAQTAIYRMAEGLLCLLAPVLCFTAEEAWGYLPAGQRPDNPALASFPAPEPQLVDDDLLARWEKILAVRAEVTRALEAARKSGAIGSSLEARVRLRLPADLADALAADQELLRVVCIVSQLVFDPDLTEGTEGGEIQGLRVAVEEAAGAKCQRCWTRSETVGDDPHHPEICQRCSAVVASL